MNENDPERRESSRVEASFRVVYPTVEKLVVAYTQNLSKGGLFIQADQLLPVGTVVRLTLVLPEDGGEITCIARVVRVRGPEGDGLGKPPGLAVRFLDMPPESLTAIEEFINTKSVGPSRAATPITFRRRLSILVVDDEASFRTSASQVLREHGHEVEEAEDGLAGLAACLKHPPDLVLTDVEMPRMDGWNLLRTLRARSSLASTLVVFQTKLAGEAERLKGYQLGVDDYLSKPYSPEELLARVERLAARTLGSDSRRPRTNALRGDLEQVSLSTVLSMLQLEQKTGVLLVVGPRTARAFVREGRPVAFEVDGDSEGKSQLQLAIELLSFRHGLFEFAPQDVSKADVVNLSMSQLLMEAARLTDEAKQ